jgi:hypothetical protein
MVAFAGFLTLLVGAALAASGLVAAAANAAQPPVGLGRADSFAVLAGSGITNTGPTTMTGDLGSFPTPSETGMGSVTLNGTDQSGDTVTQHAKNDLVTAYDDAAGRQPVTNVPVELGGTTLRPGVYASPTLGLTGMLTLNAAGHRDAEFVFKAASTLITASQSRVRLINGAQACNVVWQVGSSATFGTGTQFVGDVLAHTSITATTGAVFHGRLLARIGAVTLDTNTITRATCSATGPKPSPTPTPVPTLTPVPTATATATASPTASPTATATVTPTARATKSPIAATTSPSPRPSTAPAQTKTPTATATHSPGGGTTRRERSPDITTFKLPFTGLAIQTLVEAGLALLIAGSLIVAATRRSRKNQNS